MSAEDAEDEIQAERKLDEDRLAVYEQALALNLADVKNWKRKGFLLIKWNAMGKRWQLSSKR